MSHALSRNTTALSGVGASRIIHEQETLSSISLREESQDNLAKFSSQLTLKCKLGWFSLWEAQCWTPCPRWWEGKWSRVEQLRLGFVSPSWRQLESFWGNSIEQQNVIIVGFTPSYQPLSLVDSACSDQEEGWRKKKKCHKRRGHFLLICVIKVFFF